jgi:hypothetical protein
LGRGERGLRWPRVSAPRLHRRQFVLGPAPFHAAEEWVAEELGPSLHLSRCPELPLERVTDRRGVDWLLIGIALQSDPAAPSPARHLASSSSPLDVYRSWSGRWILTSATELHVDAGATLGCFHRTINAGSSAELWVSSSPALLAALPGKPRLSIAAPRIFHEKGMDWYPPPSSRFPAVRRLLPTQILSLDPTSRERVIARPPLDVADATNVDEAFGALQQNLVTSLTGIAERGGPVWLPLTAGVDSRVILAAAKHASLPLRTFTQTYPLMPADDRTLPPRLAERAGYEHEFVHPSRFSRSRRDLFDAHTAGHCVDADRRLFAHGQWEALPAGALILRGGVFEIGRCFYHRKFPHPVDDLFLAVANRFHFGEFHASSFAHLSGIAEWVDWVSRTPVPGLDWRDRLYLEQRIGGWVSSIEQALDLTPYERAYIANSHAYMTAALSLPEETRRSAGHHIALIRRMAPELLDFPFNPGDHRKIVLARRRLRYEWREVAARPRKLGYVAGRGTRVAAGVLGRLHARRRR